MDKQVDRIFDYMAEHHGITAAEAQSELGVARLASRIADMKNIGIEIQSEMVSGENRYGQRVHFKRYYLGG